MNLGDRQIGLTSLELQASVWLVAFVLATALPCSLADDDSQRLPNTQPLSIEGDLAALTVSGVDRFLLRELEDSVVRRADYWHRDLSSGTAYTASVIANRKRFAAMIGLRDQRMKFEDIELVATPRQAALVGKSDRFQVFAVRWPVFEGVSGEGLLLEPTAQATCSCVVIPDCEQLPEAIVGLEPGIAPGSQIARRLAESGCRVIVPTLINRDHRLSVIAEGRRPSTVTHREILNRAAYQMGRHLIGYEVQKVLAAVDWFERTADQNARTIGVIGYGEGGLLAFYAAAIDTRINVAGVSGYFDSRQGIWREPIDRNVFGLLREFGDAELATLIAPRTLIVEACAAPEVMIPPGGQSAPGRLTTPAIASVRSEIKRAHRLLEGLDPAPQFELVESNKGDGPFGSQPFLDRIMHHLTSATCAAVGVAPDRLSRGPDTQQRLERQFHELSSFSQRLVDQGPETRAQFFDKVDVRSGLDSFNKTVQPYREYFRDEIIGIFDHRRLPANPRTRLVYDEPEYRGYEVVIDVFPDVILSGILLVPAGIRPSERRPVVVCQHGLEGLAKWTIEGDYTSYRAFAARLAKRGFITFSPQHLYRGGDRFRTLQRKANPLKTSLFSVMIAQHQQLLDWLGGLDFVDRDRIAFYGISYGGKSAMRIPAILEGYCLSICSSDFSNWIWRTASNRFQNGYLAHSEYEIFEFNLGSTFNYGEMAALICPRPFMVERFDESQPVLDTIAAEYGRIRLLYETLGIGQRTRIGNFPEYLPNAPYKDRETFEFLDKQLHATRSDLRR